MVLAVLGAVTGPLTSAQASAHDVPGQFIAKVYTEALGRVPTGTEWNDAINQFAQSGCTQQSLAAFGQGVYTSADFAQLGYDNTAKLTTLFRGVWNTEPDPLLLMQHKSELSGGEPWSAVVAQFFTDPKFTELVGKICTGGMDSSSTSYSVGGTASTGVAKSTGGFAGSEEDLQKLLNDTPPGGTVQLAGRTVVQLTQPLKIPAGVTLTTTGEPSVQQYAQMGRLVRTGEFDSAAVQVAGGADLHAVWIDGARNNPVNSAPARVNVRVAGGTDTKVSGNKISNTAGSSSVQVVGGTAGQGCSNVQVTKNVITAYSNDHYQTRQLSDQSTVGTWSNGIEVGCGDVTVRRNQIVDTGGVGIAVYRAADVKGDQHSTITGNTIASAGVPMYAGITVDPAYYVPNKGSERDYDFTGTSISKNQLWTAPNTHFVIGISVGTRPWYAGMAVVGANSGHGVAVAGNGTAGIGARVRTGIAVSGMSDVTLKSDPADWEGGVPGKPGDACPSTAVAAASSSGQADGLETDLSFDDTNLDGCVGEP
jgi:hypothetical protein